MRIVRWFMQRFIRLYVDLLFWYFGWGHKVFLPLSRWLVLKASRSISKACLHFINDCSLLSQLMTSTYFYESHVTKTLCNNKKTTWITYFVLKSHALLRYCRNKKGPLLLQYWQSSCNTTIRYINVICQLIRIILAINQFDRWSSFCSSTVFLILAM